MEKKKKGKRQEDRVLAKKRPGKEIFYQSRV